MKTDKERIAELEAELAAMTAERDVRIELAADNAEFLAVLVRDYMAQWDPEGSLRPLESALRAHAGKVTR